MADSQYQHRLPQFDFLLGVNVLLHNRALLLLQSEMRQSFMLFLVYNYKHLRHKTTELEQNYFFLFYCEPVFTAIIDPNIFRFFSCQNEKHFLALLIYLQAISFCFSF